MKKFKRILSMVTAVATMLGCLTIGAHADTATKTYPTISGDVNLTVKSTKTNRAFDLYQIFYGDYEEANDGSKNLTEIEWGASIKKETEEGLSYDYTSDLITELKKTTLEDGSTNPLATSAASLKADASANDVASVLKSVSNDSTEADAFAAIVNTVLSGKSVDKVSNTSATDVTNGSRISYHYIFKNIHSGYYLVNDVTTTDNVEGSAYSKFILKVAGSTETETKIGSVPTLDKKIKKADGSLDDDIQVALGDDVEFQLSSKVPDMDGYTKYHFVVTDEMVEGLTFKEIKSITVGSETLVEKNSATDDKYYTYRTEAMDNGGTKITFVFHNFIQYKDNLNSDIKINYLATLNEKAIFGDEGNLNRAMLNYSNNPNYNYHGEDEPDPSDPTDPNYPDDPSNPKNDMYHTGATSWSNAYVFSTGINIIKVDDDSNRLAGAKFRIEGEGVLNKVVTKAAHYTAVGLADKVTAQEGETLYYKLSDGAMNEKAPKDNPDEIYMEEYVMYTQAGSEDAGGTYYYNTTDNTYETERVEGKTYEKAVLAYTKDADSTTIMTSEDDYNYEAEVGSNGLLELKGLKEGTYKLYETEAPQGYNKLTEPIEITITYTAPSESTPNKCTWNFISKDMNNNGTQVNNNGVNGIFEVSVKNLLGSTLPSTGGIGTRIFYTAGSILLLGAVILLVSKRRMRNEAM